MKLWHYLSVDSNTSYAIKVIQISYGVEKFENAKDDLETCFDGKLLLKIITDRTSLFDGIKILELVRKTLYVIFACCKNTYDKHKTS